MGGGRSKIAPRDRAMEATPMHWAVRDGHVEAVVALANLGSHLELVDR